METAEQLRVKFAEMKLTALETNFCNANWMYNSKIKSLREELQAKNKKEVELTSQLAALRTSFSEHQKEVREVLLEFAKENQGKMLTNKNIHKSPNMPCIKDSPPKSRKGLFFRVGKQEMRLNLSPSFTKTPENSWQSKAEAQPNKNPQKGNTIRLVKQNATLQTIASDRTYECPKKQKNAVLKVSPYQSQKVDEKNWKKLKQGKKGEQKESNRIQVSGKIQKSLSSNSVRSKGGIILNKNISKH